MALVHHNSISRPGVGEWLRHLAEVTRQDLAQYRLYRRTVAELRELSNRELADLGLNRSMVRQVAIDAVYGA